MKGKYYETPDFLCLENQKVVLTDFENTRLITAKPIRRTARVDYRINGIERLEKADAVYAAHVLGERQDSTNGAYFFSSNGVKPAKRAYRKSRVGGHTFYGLKPL